MITDLLDVNAIEQGKFILQSGACDIRALVRRALKTINLPPSKKGIESASALPTDLAKADPAATMQILDNLISNALKYLPPKTTIHVHTLPETNYVLVSVRDAGPGISEADQKKLFQKFTRLSARPTGGESSTGLGLAIVKRLAESDVRDRPVSSARWEPDPLSPFACPFARLPHQNKHPQRFPLPKCKSARWFPGRFSNFRREINTSTWN